MMDITFQPDRAGSQVMTFYTPELFGFHVNVDPGLMTPELEFARVYPATPRCIFAGQEDTVCLLFTDEEEARQALPGHWTEVS